MTFEEILERVLDWLKRDGRVSYRAIKRQFGIDDDYVEDLKVEIIQSRRMALDEDGGLLVWAGVAAPRAAPAPMPPSPDRQRTAREDHPGQDDGPPADRTAPDAERRQLTVLFCDIVDSTGLASALDPEDYLDVIRAYQAASAEVVERFEGTIAQYLGDGLLVYFGYPQAHEDDAQRAVRAGLGIIEAVGALKARLQRDKGVRLAIRLGVHTGLVVVGDIGAGGRRERLALGQPLNIAAHLQAIAAPDTMVVSAATRELIQGYFLCQDLGPHSMKGIASPVSVFRVLGESGAQNRFEVAMARGLTPLVGRHGELALLSRLWAEASAGKGHVVVLRGDAGIGKSRLSQALTEHIGPEGATRLALRFLPHFRHSALYPVIDHLRQTLQFRGDDSAEATLTKLERSLAVHGVSLPDVLPLFASLLSIPLSGRYPPLHLSPARRRQRTTEALLEWFAAEAARQPLFMVWEDLHWADPSTLELLSLLIDRIPFARILMLLTCRPPCALPWSPQPYITELTLSHLSPDEVGVLVGQLAEGRTLPAGVRAQIVAKTDGVPLFVEEVTKMVLESGVAEERDGRDEADGARPPLALAIPATLQDSLMARLDRLVTAKGVAQLAAVLGREFSYELLRAVSSSDEEVLRQGLQRLVEAEFIYGGGSGPGATYIFKHALIRDAAYQLLLKSTRQHYHHRIAEVLTEQFPVVVETQPELVAHHYEAAGLTSEAIVHWLRAGQRAIRQSSNVEAIEHLRRGLGLVGALPDTPERTRHELTLHLSLGSALIATKGYAAPEVEHAYTRARALCQQIGEVPRLLNVLLGLEAYYVVRADLRTAYDLAEQCLHLARQVENAERVLNSHHALGLSLFHLGESAAALVHLKQGIVLYDRQRERPHHNLQDPGVACRCYAAWALWHLGYPEQARVTLDEALALARGLAHPYTMAYALCFAAGLYQYRRQAPVAERLAAEAIAISREHVFPFWFAMGTCEYGWALAEQGRGEEGVEQLRRGIAAWRATGAELAQPHWLALFAEACGRVDRVGEGLAALTEALERADRHGERYYEAELHRLHGELLLRQPNAADDLAEAGFHRALDVARRQGAKSAELRAGVSLSRLWQRQGQLDRARASLAERHGWFTEGFDTRDLQEARALLEELS